MKKRIFSLILMLVLLLSCSVATAESSSAGYDYFIATTFPFFNFTEKALRDNSENRALLAVMAIAEYQTNVDANCSINWLEDIFVYNYPVDETGEIDETLGVTFWTEAGKCMDLVIDPLTAAVVYVENTSGFTCESLESFYSGYMNWFYVIPGEDFKLASQTAVEVLKGYLS